MSARSVAVVVVAGVVLGVSPLYAERKPRHSQPEAGAEREVTDLLRRETASPLDRRTSLHPLLNRIPDSSSARWQSGYTRTEKSWRSYDTPLAAEHAALLAEYRNHRREAPRSVRGQMVLAAWCSEHGLKDEARAHRSIALLLAKSSEQLQILKSLGYQQVDGEWRSPGEARDAKRSAQDAETSLRLWGPRIERIARQFQGNVRDRGIARAALLEITDPGAIPALEIYLGPHEPAMLVEKLGSMQAYEASLSLARFAVFSNSSDVRRSATRSLSERRKEDYVPPLIGLLSTPVRAGVAVSSVSKGWIYESVLTTETSNRLQVWRSTKAYFPIVASVTYSRALGMAVGSSAGDLDSANSGNPFTRQELANDASRTLGDQAYQTSRFVNSKNSSIEELNSRVSCVLSEVSGQPKSIEAADWWNWWGDFSGLQSTGTKIVDEFDDDVEVYRPVVTNIQFISCFQAGTPVWTESGMQPIESICVGDRVLAQDVETGELAYKPVLQTTVRAPHQLVQVNAGADAVTCTDGHRFWVTGEAWIKARDLKPKHLLHSARGTIRVESVSEAGVDRTYNLVVADLHSYFVGKQALLVQDLPLPRSTNCVVPGLQPE